MRYPLSPAFLAASLVAYAVALWRRPALFLLVLPAVLPAWDLGLWTGWMMVDEADFFILATLAVLLARDPPRLADLLPSGLSRIVLLGFTASWAIATVTGLASPAAAAHSANPFLRPDNALRLAKGYFEALALLPFLRQQERGHADAVSLLGWGMAAGLVAVAVVVLAERVLFAGILDFSAEYRVAGPFSSMRVGGGHIGAYVALALPMALCLPRLHPRWLGMSLLALTCVLGGYTLVVTFARTAYLAGIVAMGIAGIGWMWASRRQDRPSALGLSPILLVLAAVAAAASSGGMRDRVASSTHDFETRRANWEAGLAVQDKAAMPILFGMGLGTYQRTMLMRSLVNRPTDILLGGGEQERYVSMQVESPFFLGQKVPLPAHGNLHLTLLARSAGLPATLGVLLCDKVLLYSDNCRGDGVLLDAPDVWRLVAMALPTEGLGAGWGPLRRPVEMSLAGSPVGRRVDVRDVRLTDDAGRSVLANGDFRHGLDRWIFTDDSHVSWRMLSLYLMVWFQTGVVGLVAFVSFSGLAVAGGIRAAWRGAVTGAAVAGSVAGLLVSGLFDDVLEAPRLATLFFLVCLCGLVQWEDRRRLPRLTGPEQRAEPRSLGQAPFYLRYYCDDGRGQVTCPMSFDSRGVRKLSHS